VKPSAFPRRRMFLRTLAGAVLVPVSRLSPGQTGKGDGDEKKGGKAAKAGKSAVLTVLVTGNGKPVSQAEVKALFSGGSEATRFTNESGEALFNSAGTGKGSVRVIASGWASAIQDVTLREGTQRVTVELSPLAAK
jgi:hypothetical protein